jgi:hypothetical protein
MADHDAQLTVAKALGIEPAHVTMKTGCAYTGDTRSRMYEAIGKGEVEAVKEGRRTLLVFESLKRRVAARKPAKIAVHAPTDPAILRTLTLQKKLRKQRARKANPTGKANR